MLSEQLGCVWKMWCFVADIAMDWSDHALWWPARNMWLARTRSTLDQYGVQADALLHFTPMHKTLRVQLPDLRYLDCRVNFSIKTFNAVVNLCKELGKKVYPLSHKYSNFYVDLNQYTDSRSYYLALFCLISWLLTWLNVCFSHVIHLLHSFQLFLYVSLIMKYSFLFLRTILIKCHFCALFATVSRLALGTTQPVGTGGCFLTSEVVTAWSRPLVSKCLG
jgi:hypothetical protein